MVIGFERELYFVNESDREVVVAVVLREGELQGRTVRIGLSTMDGSALSEYTRTLPLLLPPLPSILPLLLILSSSSFSSFFSDTSSTSSSILSSTYFT